MRLARTRRRDAVRPCISVIPLIGSIWRVVGFLGQRLLSRALPRLPTRSNDSPCEFPYSFLSEQFGYMVIMLMMIEYIEIGLDN